MSFFLLEILAALCRALVRSGALCFVSVFGHSIWLDLVLSAAVLYHIACAALLQLYGHHAATKRTALF
jgi:hypothetical protein